MMTGMETTQAAEVFAGENSSGKNLKELLNCTLNTWLKEGKPAVQIVVLQVRQQPLVLPPLPLLHLLDETAHPGSSCPELAIEEGEGRV